LELKKLGIELDMPPNKLKAGHGDGVCSVLAKLCQVSIQNKFKFKKPVIKEDTTQLEEEADEMNDDMDGGGDIADLANKEGSDEDIEDFNDFGGQGANAEQENIQN
jgi:estrogen-related receptor beta like 1